MFAGTPQGEKASMQGFEMLLYGTGDGTGLYDRDNEKWILGNPGFVESLAFLKTLFEEELTASLGQHLDPNISETIYTSLLPEGKLGILIDGSWISQNWTESAARPWPEWPDVIGLADMPTQDGEGPGTVTLAGGWGLSIPAHVTDREIAFQFLEKLVSTETLVRYAQADNHITVRADVAENEEYLSYSPAVEYFTDLLETAYYRPALPAYPEVSSALQEADGSRDDRCYAGSRRRRIRLRHHRHRRTRERAGGRGMSTDAPTAPERTAPPRRGAVTSGTGSPPRGPCRCSRPACC